MGNAVTAGTLILDVNLDTTKNPPVEIGNRNAKGDVGGKIKWKKESGAPDFTFSGFDPQSMPFKNVKIADNKIECDFDPAAGTPGDTKFPYTVTVCYNKTTYTSDEAEVSLPTEGRAVIRN